MIHAFDVKQLTPMFETLTEGVILVSKDSIIRYVNASCEKLFGYFPGELIGQQLNVLLPKSVRPDHHHMVKNYHDTATVPRHMSNRPVLSAIRKTGEPLQVSVSLSNVTFDGETYSAAVISDAQMIANSDNNILRELAEKDALTGLVNRVFLSKVIQKQIEDNSLFTLFFMDLNKFKPINDEHGHEVGDHILKVVADRLKRHIRTGDCAARIGGDEFVVLVNSLENPERIEQLSKQLEKAIAEPIEYESLTLSVGVSIGAAIFPIHGTSEAELLKASDKAMYTAKKSGKSHHLYSPSATAG